MMTLEEELQAAITGEVKFDPITCAIYSVDASIYEIAPVGVVLPKTEQDLIAAVKIANKQRIPIIARGAATGIAGGCIGKGLIIDTSKYLTKILSVDWDNETTLCQPGVIQDQLNGVLSEKGYRLGPDTSTGNRATIGGMVANNSAGARSLKFGKMVDHVLEVKLLLYSGEILTLKHMTLEEAEKKEGIEGDIYSKLLRIRTEHEQAIRKHFPSLPRRASGYPLDTLLNKDPINFAQLVVGSEGSLGIVTQVKLRIVPSLPKTELCIVHFDACIPAMEAIQTFLKHAPIAVEMIDKKIIESGKMSPAMRGKLAWLKGEPEVLFVAECEAGEAKKLKDTLIQENIGYFHTLVTDPLQMQHVWDLRKSGLGLLLSKKTYNRAVAFIEDLSVPPKRLAAFMTQFLKCLEKHGKTAGIYGHVGSGCLHIRPYIDLRSNQEQKKMQELMEEVFEIIISHQGAMSGEHGDGLLRSWLNPRLFGQEIYQAFVALKEAFDPDYLMNPGKVVQGPPLLENLRAAPSSLPFSPFLNYSKEGGFDLAIDLCNGNATCRKKEGTMCPSFHVTGDEYDSTRARAQALRSLINGNLPSDTPLLDVLDLCLECKGCKTECPSQIDMAKLKAEILYQYQEKHGYFLRNRLFGNVSQVNVWFSSVASLYNTCIQTSFFKKIQNWFGISPERTLPLLAKKRFSKSCSKPTSKGKPIYLFNDTFTEFHTPSIGTAAVQVLEALGYSVRILPWVCCGRPLISKGLLKQARTQAKRLLTMLNTINKEGIPIIGLEPSCIFTLIDDYPSLLPDAKLPHWESIDTFLAAHIKEGKLPLSFKEDPISILIHGHCHQKALVGVEPALHVLRAIPSAEVTEIPSGCCGMAGSFGYEKEHYALSIKIGELKLMPTIRAAPKESLLVADGFSCRSQIAHGCEGRPLHLVELLAQRLVSFP